MNFKEFSYNYGLINEDIDQEVVEKESKKIKDVDTLERDYSEKKSKKENKPKDADKTENTEEEKLPPEEKEKVDEEAKKLGLDEKKTGLLKKAWMMAYPMIKKQSFDTLVKYADIALLNQVPDALAEIWRVDKLEKMNPEKLPEEMEALENDDAWKKGKKYKDLDNRKDDNTSTKIDTDSLEYEAIWFTKKKDENILNILTEMKKKSTELLDKAKEQDKKIKDYIKSNNLEKDVTEDDIAKYGSVLITMIDQKASNEDIKKKIAELRNTVKESVEAKLYIIRKHNLLIETANLNESKVLITEELKESLEYESLFENDEICESIAEWMINEGLWDKIKGGISKAKDKVKEKIVGGLKGLGKIMATPAMKMIIKGAGIAFSAFTLGIGATVIIKIFDAFEMYGKYLRNGIERQFTKFANSKGIIAKMDFALADDKSKKYSLRYYVTDEVWRGVNKTDQLKYPSKDFIKTILDGDEGKKFRDRLDKVWGPIFLKQEGQLDLISMMKQAENLKIPEKQMKLLQDFYEQYESIRENCIQDPKIDTRAKSVKDAVKDGAKKTV